MIYVSNTFPHILFSIFLRLFIFIFVELFSHYNKILLLFLPLFIVPTQITLRAQTTPGDSIYRVWRAAGLASGNLLQGLWTTVTLSTMVIVIIFRTTYIYLLLLYARIMHSLLRTSVNRN